MRCRTGTLLLMLSWSCGLVAQRAPCTGTVVDAAGVPLADAAVIFVEDPWQTFGEDPDRVEAKTNAAGAFGAELRPGGFYVVWAIGPADQTGARAVCDAQPVGAAGRTLTLRAGRMARPHRFALSYCHLVERRIADANGQLVVRHGETPAHLVVIDARGIAVALLGPPAGDAAQQAVQQVALQPLRWIELTVVDGARRPLRGARVIEGRVLGMATDPVAAMAAWFWLASLRADADGRLRLPLFDDGLEVQIGVGELRSDLVELRDTRARYLRLR